MEGVYRRLCDARVLGTEVSNAVVYLSRFCSDKGAGCGGCAGLLAVLRALQRGDLPGAQEALEAARGELPGAGSELDVTRLYGKLGWGLCESETAGGGEARQCRRRVEEGLAAAGVDREEVGRAGRVAGRLAAAGARERRMCELTALDAMMVQQGVEEEAGL